MSEMKIEIWGAIQSCNESWTSGSPQDVGPMFHENAVMLSPQGKQIARGRDEIVHSLVVTS